MTRINVVPPEELFRQHLGGEIKEITRVFSFARLATQQYGNKDNWAKAKKPPQHYTMGKGHVNFFVPRLSFIVERYKALCDDWRSRGYNVSEISAESLLEGIDSSFLGGYNVTDEAMQVNRERIALRLSEMKAKEKK